MEGEENNIIVCMTTGQLCGAADSNLGCVHIQGVQVWMRATLANS